MKEATKAAAALNSKPSLQYFHRHRHTAIFFLLLHLGSIISITAAFSPKHHPSRAAHRKNIKSSSMHTTTTTSTLFAKPSPPPIQWGIIGLGDVCTIKSGPAFYKSSNSALIAVMRRTPGAAQRWVEENREVVQRYNNNDGVTEGVELRGYDNIEQMIHENIHQLDAIYVATPPSVHLDNVRQILSALDSATINSSEEGKDQRLKAIYVEKPCGRSAWETRTMIDELQYYRNIQFFPAYVSRAHERTQTLIQLLSVEQQQHQQGQHDDTTEKNSISSNEEEKTTTIIGDKVTSIHYTQRGSSFARGLDGGGGIPWRLNAEQSGGGLIMDMGCHILDRFDYLFGPITNVKSEVLRKGGGKKNSDHDDEDNYPLVEDYVAMSGTIGKCDWAAAIPLSAEGASVDCLWDFSPHADDQDELLITGTNGISIRMAGMGAGMPIEVLDVDGRTVLQRIEFEAPMHAAQPLIQSIVNELRGGVVNDGGGGGADNNQQCLVKSPSRADNAIRTSEVLDSILNSYYGGRHDEFWTRPDSWPGLKK